MADEENIDITTACPEEKAEANLCIQMTPPETCSKCYDDTSSFGETYAIDLRSQFLETQGYVTDTDPKFCSIANDRMCNYFTTNNGCCCVEIVQTYRKCLFDNVLIPSVPRVQAGSVACIDRCDYFTHNVAGAAAATEEGGDDGGSLGVIIGAAVGGVVVLLAVVFGVYYCFMKGGSGDDNGGGNGTNTKKKGKEKKSSLSTKKDDVEQGSGGGSGSDDVSQLTESNKHQNVHDGNVSDEDDEEHPMEEEEEEEGPKRPKERGINNNKNKKQQPKKTRSKAAMEAACDDYVGAVNSIEKVEVHSEELDRLKKKKERIKEWREMRKEGSSQSLHDYLSDEDL
jgi:hypothetical protein